MAKRRKPVPVNTLISFHRDAIEVILKLAKRYDIILKHRFLLSNSFWFLDLADYYDVVHEKEGAWLRRQWANPTYRISALITVTCTYSRSQNYGQWPSLQLLASSILQSRDNSHDILTFSQTTPMKWRMSKPLP